MKINILNDQDRIPFFFDAAFTPMTDFGDINLPQVKNLADFHINEGIDGFYINGSTGEGPSLTLKERQLLSEKWCRDVNKRVPVIVHVGDPSLPGAMELAKSAAGSGADAIACLPPYYFRPDGPEQLVLFLRKIAESAPELPFYYYHLPAVTRVDFDLVHFLEIASKSIKTFAGIKYSAFNLPECQACVDFDGGANSIFWGCDEAILAGWTIGCVGGVGSTYNFALPLYKKIRDFWLKGDLISAKDLQSDAVNLVRICQRYGGHCAFKAIMKIRGVDCGPCRLPIRTLSQGEQESLKRDIEKIGFFKWMES